ncbi:hypothetical protein TCSYLVIO_009801 [Trypanosoma cruzi]|nr:hypothetical protein TCSYLVIO_009801 [Trypanosoma cruzi]
MTSVYRDPVSQLAIVPPEAMEREARDALHRLLSLSLNASGVIPVIVYYAHVTRRTRRGKSIPCYLLLSRSHWYIFKPRGKISRCCRIDCIAKVIICRDNYVVWKILEGRDVLMRLGDAKEVAFVTNILRILSVSVAGRHLLVVENNGEDHTKLHGADKPQLERTGHEEGEWPLPVVSAFEAQQQYTVENFLMMMPPPPSSQPSQSKSELDAEGTRRNSRVNAIISYMDGHVEIPPVSVAPEAVVAHAGESYSNAGFPDARQAEAVIPPSVNSPTAPSTAVSSTIRRIQPVSNGNTEKQQLISPSPHDSSGEFMREAVASRPPPPVLPPPFIHLLDTEGGGSPEVRLALEKLRDMESRVTSLERENASLRRSRAHGDLESQPPQRTLKEANDPLRTPSPLPSSSFIRLAPPPRISSQQENFSASAADFERCVAAKKVEERLSLRGYEIELKLQQVSSYMQAADAQHLTHVTSLQEDLLLLLRAQRADEELGMTKRKGPNSVDIARPKAQTTSRDLLDEDDNVDHEEKEEEGVGLDDYDVWATTDEGKEWYIDYFGEHLAACRGKMVRNAFRHTKTYL